MNTEPEQSEGAMAKKICGAVRVYEGKEYVCHRHPGHTRWWHQNKEGNFRWKQTA